MPQFSPAAPHPWGATLSRSAPHFFVRVARSGGARWGIRAEDELAPEAALLEAAVSLGDLVERDPLGDARLDGATREQRCSRSWLNQAGWSARSLLME